MDNFTRYYKILQPPERKKCDAHFAKNSADKEKKMYSELRKMKSRTSEELAIRIYDDKEKTVATRQLRKQVTDKLEEYIRENIVVANKGAANIRRLMDFAEFLIGRHAPDLALDTLKVAEEEAIQSRSYELLENIYQFKINHAVVLDVDAGDAFEDWKLNNVRNTSKMHLKSAQGILVQLLNKHRKDGTVPDQNELMRQFYEDFSPNNDEKRNPDFMLGVAQIFRRVMLSTKDYWRIEPAVRDIYNTLIENNGFTPADNAARRTFLLILAQACFRNRKFDEAEDYLKEMQQLLDLPILKNDPDYAKLQSLRAAIFTYTDRCEQAGELLRKHLYGPEPIEYEPERLNMQLNLAVNYFCLKDYHRSMEQLTKLNLPEAHYEQLVGREWVYKKRMIHMIICRELGQFEEAEERLRSIRADFEQFLSQELYQRALVFMDFVLRWFQDPDLITDPDFHREVRDAHIGWGEREDIQAIFFFCWFRAPMLGQAFYPTFQSRLKETGADWDYPFSMK